MRLEPKNPVKKIVLGLLLTYFDNISKVSGYSASHANFDCNFYLSDDRQRLILGDEDDYCSFQQPLLLHQGDEDILCNPTNDGHFCTFDHNTFILDSLPSGDWYGESDGKTVKAHFGYPDDHADETPEHNMHRCGQPIYKRFTQKYCPEFLDESNRTKRSTESNLWKPRMETVSPTSIPSHGGRMMVIEGEQLFPPEIDILSDSYVRIFFINKNDPSNIMECKQESFIIKSSPFKLVCTTPKGMKTGTWKVRPMMYDKLQNRMRYIHDINPGAGLGDCNKHNRGCHISVYDETRGPYTNLYGNRYINGKEDNFYWTNWLRPYNGADEARDTFKKLNAEGYRAQKCDYPLKIEARTVIDQIPLEKVEGIIIDRFDVFHGLTVKKSSQQVMQNGTLIQIPEFEIRFLCDTNVLHSYGYYRDSEIFLTEKLQENLVGVSPPELYEADGTNEPMHVGSCNFKYNNINYPNSYGNGIARDHDWWGAIRCHVSSTTNFIGPVTIKTLTEKTGQFYHNNPGNPAKTFYLNDNMDEPYNIYIAPIITEISHTEASHRGGLEITIKGNKFAFRNAEANVKVGHNQCVITSRTPDEIKCIIDENTSPCDNNKEFPGGPGMTMDIYQKSVSSVSAAQKAWFSAMWDRDTGKTDYYSLDKKFSFDVQDAFAQIGPKFRTIWGGDADMGNWYLTMMRGWFTAPKTGWYKFLNSGDDFNRMWSNSKEPSCPMNSLEDNTFDADSDMYLMSKSDAASSESEIDAISEAIYLEKGEERYFRIGGRDAVSNEHLTLGLIFLGEETDGDGGYTNSDDMKYHKNHWLEEEQKVSIQAEETIEQQRFTFCDDTSEDCSASADSYQVKIAYSQGQNEREVTLDLSKPANELALQLKSEIFDTKCVYDDNSFITKVYRGFETSDEVNMWPERSFHDAYPSRPSAYCGRRSWRGEVGYRWLYNHNANGLGRFNILTEEITHICLAHTGFISQFDLLMESNFEAREHRWATTVNWQAPEGEWVHRCVNIIDMLANDSRANAGGLGPEAGDFFDRGFTKLMFNGFQIVGGVDRHDPNGALVDIDEVRIGLLISGDGAPISRDQGVSANDGHGVSSVSFDLDEDNHAFIISMSRSTNSREPDAVLDWTIEDAVVKAVNGQTVNSVDGSAMVEHISHPSKSFGGIWKINGKELDPKITAEELKSFFLDHFGYNVNIDMVSPPNWGFKVTFLDLGLNPPLLDYDLSGITGGSEAPIIETLWEGGIITLRMSPNWIRGINDNPQVTVTIGNSPAICGGDCSMTLVKDKYQISQHTFDQQSQEISFSFVDDVNISMIESVKLGDYVCSGLVENVGTFTCKVSQEMCAGHHLIKILIQDFGHALLNDDEFAKIPVTITHGTNLNKFSPAGGAILSFADNKFCSGSLSHGVIKDRASSNDETYGIVKEIAFDDTTKEITLQIPSLSFNDPATGSMDLYIDFGSNSEFDFTLCPDNERPTISAVTNNLGIQTGKGQLLLSGSNLGSNQGNSFIRFGQDIMQIQKWSDSEIIAITTINHTPEEQDLEIYFGNQCNGHAESYEPFQITVNLSYSNIYPANPSVLGGEIYEIHGNGFPANLDHTRINIKDYNGNNCQIKSSDHNLITCQMEKNLGAFHTFDTTGEQKFEGNVQPNFKPSSKTVNVGSNVEFCWNFAGFESIQLAIPQLNVLSPSFTYNTCWTFNFKHEGNYEIISNKLLGESNSDLTLFTSLQVIPIPPRENLLNIKVDGYQVDFDDSVIRPAQGECYQGLNTSQGYIRSLSETPVVSSFQQTSSGFVKGRMYQM